MSAKLPVFHGDPDTLGPAGVAEIMDAGEVEPPGRHRARTREALPVVGVTPALAEKTSGVEPAGEAERVAAVKSEALVP